MFFPAIVTPDDGAYVITFPDAPGCVTQVDRLADALPMASEALSGWLDATLDAGEPVPKPKERRRAPRGSRSMQVPVVPTSTALRILLREARNEEGVTYEALAERLGVTVASVRRLERGRANPTLATFDRVAMALNRTPVVSLVREPGSVYRAEPRKVRRTRG
jgi:predicted RNase H-like HicB family nuclease/DNA-binding XRE family transcriptional regulator